MTINDCTFTNNQANTAGAIRSFNKEFTVTKSTFTNNQAKSSLGGAINTHSGKSTLTKSTFTNNQAKSNGGAIYNLAKSMQITDSNFKGNKGKDNTAIFSGMPTL